MRKKVGSILAYSPTAWWSFRDPSKLYTDTGLTTPITSSGQSIAGVADRTGNGHTLTQSTAGARPTYTTATFPFGSASFDGGDGLTSTEAASVWKFLHYGSMTVYVVAYHALSNAAGILLCTHSISGASTGTAIFIDDRGATPASDRLASHTPKGSGAPVYDEPAASNLFRYGDNSFPASTLGLVRYQHDTTTPQDAKFRALGTDLSTARDNAPNNADPTTTLCVGRTSGASLALTGHIVDIVVFNSYLSTADDAAIRRILGVAAGGITE